MSWFSEWTSPGRPYKEAQKQYDKYYQEAQGYQQPYNQFGQNQQGTLQDYINSLHDPAGLRDKWEQGYKESDAAKNAEDMAQQHGLNSASSMGLMGSNTALNAIQSGTAGIAAEDKQNYLKDLMEKYMQGAGLSNDVYKTGAGAASQQGQNAMTQGERSAQMTFGQHQAPANMFGSTVGTIGKGALGFLGGGPAGAAWALTGGRK